MKRTFSFLILFIIFLLTSSILCAQNIENEKSVEERIKIFFENEDINALRPLLADDGRVFLSLEKIKNVKGFFSANQALLIFKEFFALSTILDFAQTSIMSGPSSPLFINARITFKDTDARISTLAVSFALAKRNGSWKIKEIKEAGS